MDIAVRRHFIKTSSSYVQLIPHQPPHCLPTQHFAVIKNFWSTVLKFLEFWLIIPISWGQQVKNLLTMLYRWQDWGTSKLKGLCRIMQWIIFAIISKISDFQDQTLAAIWLHTAICICSLIKVNRYSWQAWILFLCSSSPKMTELQYPNSSCDRRLFVQEDPRSQQLIQKIVSQWIISDHVFKKMLCIIHGPKFT